MKIKPFIHTIFLLLTINWFNSIVLAAPLNLNVAIETVQKQLNSDSTISDEVKANAMDQLRRANDELELAKQRAEVLKAQVQMANNAESLILESAKKLAKLTKSAPVVEVEPNQAVSTLEVLSAEQRGLRNSLSELQANKVSLLSRSGVIAKELVSARTELVEIQNSISLANADVSNFTASQLYTQSRQFNLSALISDLEVELTTIPIRQQVVSAQIDLTEAQLNNTNQQIEKLQAYLTDTRFVLAEDSITKAQTTLSIVEGESLEIQALAKENLDLTTQLRNLATEAESVVLSTSLQLSEMKSLDQSKETVERVIATGLVTDDLVDVLRELRKNLPKTTPLAKLLSNNQSAQTKQQLNLILWQNKLRGLQDVSQAAVAFLKAKSPGRTEFSNEEILAAKKLAQERKQILQSLIDAANSQSDRLVTEKLAVTDTLLATNNLVALLDRRLLWLPSRTGPDGQFFENLIVGVKWLVSSQNWKSLVHDFKAGIFEAPWLTLIFIFLPLSLLIVRKSLNKGLFHLAKKVGHVALDNYSTTPLAILATFLISLPLPLLLVSFSGIITSSQQSSLFSTSISKGLFIVSSLFLILNVFKNMCRAEGLFTDHFSWSAIARERLKYNLIWFNRVLSISSFLFVVSLSSGISELRYGVALLCFLIISFSISAFQFQFFKPNGGVVVAIFENRITSSFILIAWPFFMIAPLLIGLLPLIGYFDTAIELQSRVIQSGIILFLSAVTFGLCMRLYNVGYRRYKLEKLKSRRNKLSEERKLSTHVQESGEAIPSFVNPYVLDTEKINMQARRVLYFITGIVFLLAVWFIWSPLFPALGIIDEIVLWESSKLIDGVEVDWPITLWSLILSVFFIFGGFIAAKNIRGLLEIGLFERMNLNSGERYATITIIGYILIGSGLVFGLSQLGINWSKLQWFVAALAVGLGFGLQEIVANFISGLIILFERPVRVGDVVTIGSLSGTVRNIKIRATTITDFDNRDVLLPNKSIITENVTNWTLNDAVTRLIIPIGVAYGTNIELVHRLLMQVVTSHEDVLETPPPAIFFISHGESSLDFEVRIFVATPIKRLPVTHDINSRINAILNEHHIEIPFPQRTVHMVTK